jgi:hypothetical protein
MCELAAGFQCNVVEEARQYAYTTQDDEGAMAPKNQGTEAQIQGKNTYKALKVITQTTLSCIGPQIKPTQVSITGL